MARWVRVNPSAVYAVHRTLRDGGPGIPRGYSGVGLSAPRSGGLVLGTTAVQTLQAAAEGELGAGVWVDEVMQYVGDVVKVPAGWVHAVFNLQVRTP